MTHVIYGNEKTEFLPKQLKLGGMWQHEKIILTSEEGL